MKTRIVWMLVGMGATLALLALFALAMAPSLKAQAEAPSVVAFAPPAPPEAEEAKKESLAAAPKRAAKVLAHRRDEAKGGADKPGSPEPAATIVGGLLDREDGAEMNGGETAAEVAPSRAWFPETFLFEPALVTDARGEASLEVKVPDRLTTWRVLALAHSRQGAQAGTTASFLGTLPTYVEPVTPKFLVAGDEVRLPIQVVNTTDAKVSSRLEVEVDGRSALSSSLTLLPAESRVTYATVKVGPPGTLSLRSSLGSADATARTVRVVSSGKPVELHLGGTLAAPRSFELASPEGLFAEDAALHVAVFPGALALLRSELAAAVARSSVADDAYALLLAGKGPSLLRALGEQEDPQAIRTLSVLTSQRVLAHARAPAEGTAGLLLEAAATHPGTPVLARLSERLAAGLAGAQRPDGTFQGGDGWPLQRLLVATADGVRAVRAQGLAPEATPAAAARAKRVSVLAAGAFERFAAQVKDGYTAAAVLGSGVVEGPVAERLRAQVKEAVTARADGSKVLTPAPGVQRADGAAPSEAEATALGALALAEADPLRAELGGSVLGGYRPALGWGDGSSNLACLRAVVTLFKDPLPAQVSVRLEVDGREVASGALVAAKAKEPLWLRAAAPPAGAHAYRLVAEPAVPGLGFSLTLSGHVAWKKESPRGLELTVQQPAGLKVGAPAEIQLVAAAPAGVATEIRHELPAGVQPVLASLEALVEQQRVQSYDVEEGAVTLHLPARAGGGAPFQASYRVVPTLAGTLHASASRIRAVGGAEESEYHVPPVAWSVR